MIKKCLGCGVTLQSTNPQMVGYVKDLLTGEMVYCERCFKLKNYNQTSDIPLKYNNDDLVTIINEQAKQVIFMIDFLNISAQTINTFKQIKVKKYLVISKLDIIPKGFFLKKIEEQIKRIYDLNDHIIFISSLKKIHMGNMENILKDKETFITGYTNCGKSTLINALFPDSKIITSNMMNTTLEVIKMSKEEYTIYDTPGFQFRDLPITDLKVLRKLNTNNLIKPITYQLKPNSAISFNDIVFKNLDSKNTSVTLYLSYKPIIKRLFNVKNSSNVEYLFNDQDVIINGLGFINIKQCNQMEIITNIKELEIRESLFR